MKNNGSWLCAHTPIHSRLTGKEDRELKVSLGYTLSLWSTGSYIRSWLGKKESTSQPTHQITFGIVFTSVLLFSFWDSLRHGFKSLWSIHSTMKILETSAIVTVMVSWHIDEVFQGRKLRVDNPLWMWVMPSCGLGS
jgi:hypothetical protein